ncbi:uncharacterized protein LOC128259048 isoform X1 [Drosophila gunungcola]|nr:uncharacterized protein LOC128259048 isoform X1 [Drosophila gunungcola]XP_052847127.1 uncharacterized protein LOC128259048 isoform X1 [Drosophila gunungcola]XP_052847128.1 uncharacterized protein LOC128259048 isoform X1 [Drosophila gunungcola]XP_052847129.1 uncharacterized protein LOC128259048 isoform X1 [Drosophila gunungcola]XP_052847130.1 uncharacterized protein LOC128259048 isoform X1 [Drosophila gunungcola]XP_052847131.1 uncharacterized protein LOC128259048 isoform X1 [Drosophila gunun
MPQFWKNLWLVIDSLTDPPRRSQDSVFREIPVSSRSLQTFLSLQRGRRPKRLLIPSISRHVAFSPSTLEHQKNRKLIMQADTSAFQNFVREMYEGYYDLVISQERRKHGFQPDQQLNIRRLGFKDLVRLQALANDLWKRMDRGRKQKYKELALEALHRRRLRLPPDPFRIPPHIKKSSNKLKKTRSVFVRF